MARHAFSMNAPECAKGGVTFTTMWIREGAHLRSLSAAIEQGSTGPAWLEISVHTGTDPNFAYGNPVFAQGFCANNGVWPYPNLSWVGDYVMPPNSGVKLWVVNNSASTLQIASLRGSWTDD